MTLRCTSLNFMLINVQSALFFAFFFARAFQINCHRPASTWSSHFTFPTSTWGAYEHIKISIDLRTHTKHFIYLLFSVPRDCRSSCGGFVNGGLWPFNALEMSVCHTHTHTRGTQSCFSRDAIEPKTPSRRTANVVVALFAFWLH